MSASGMPSSDRRPRWVRTLYRWVRWLNAPLTAPLPWERISDER